MMDDVKKEEVKEETSTSKKETNWLGLIIFILGYLWLSGAFDNHLFNEDVCMNMARTLDKSYAGIVKTTDVEFINNFLGNDRECKLYVKNINIPTFWGVEVEFTFTDTNGVSAKMDEKVDIKEGETGAFIFKEFWIEDKLKDIKSIKAKVI